MIPNRFNRPKPLPKEEGCKVRIKRDKLGRIVGYDTNSKCSPKELEMLKESKGGESKSGDEE